MLVLSWFRRFVHDGMEVNVRFVQAATKEILSIWANQSLSVDLRSDLIVKAAYDVKILGRKGMLGSAQYFAQVSLNSILRLPTSGHLLEFLGHLACTDCALISTMGMDRVPIHIFATRSLLQDPNRLTLFVGHQFENNEFMSDEFVIGIRASRHLVAGAWRGAKLKLNVKMPALQSLPDLEGYVHVNSRNRNHLRLYVSELASRFDATIVVPFFSTQEGVKEHFVNTTKVVDALVRSIIGFCFAVNRLPLREHYPRINQFAFGFTYDLAMFLLRWQLSFDLTRMAMSLMQQLFMLVDTWIDFIHTATHKFHQIGEHRYWFSFGRLVGRHTLNLLDHPLFQRFTPHYKQTVGRLLSRKLTLLRRTLEKAQQLERTSLHNSTAPRFTNLEEAQAHRTALYEREIGRLERMRHERQAEWLSLRRPEESLFERLKRQFNLIVDQESHFNCFSTALYFVRSGSQRFWLCCWIFPADTMLPSAGQLEREMEHYRSIRHAWLISLCGLEREGQHMAAFIDQQQLNPLIVYIHQHANLWLSNPALLRRWVFQLVSALHTLHTHGLYPPMLSPLNCHLDEGDQLKTLYLPCLSMIQRPWSIHGPLLYTFMAPGTSEANFASLTEAELKAAAIWGVGVLVLCMAFGLADYVKMAEAVREQGADALPLGFDPALARLVVACLQADPQARPDTHELQSLALPPTL